MTRPTGYGPVTAAQVDGVARICHEANRAYCLLTGDPALPPWDELEESYRDSNRNGVIGVIAGDTPEQTHSAWMMERFTQGWVLGAPLDRECKVHPNLVPYDQLPDAQRRKDTLFLNIVEAVLGPPR